MKKFLVIISFVSILFSQDWQWELPKPFGNTLNDVHFINADTGWAVGSVGRIIRTFNGGKTWDLLNCGVEDNLIDCQFYKNYGWIVTDNKKLLSTKDYGQTWEVQAFPVHIAKVFALNERTVWLNCDLYEYPLLHTIDGVNWEQYNNGGFGFYAVNDTLCFIGIGDNKIGRSIDAGKTFTIMELSTDIMQLKNFSFINKDTGWVADNLNGNVFKTYDGGKRWERLTNSTNKFYFSEIQFVNANVGFVLNSNTQDIHITSDGGKTWKIEYGPPGGTHNVCFVNDSTGYTVSYAGLVHKTQNRAQNWVKINSEIVIGFKNVDFVQENIGIASGFAIYRTENNGQSWSEVVKYDYMNGSRADCSSNPEKNILYILEMYGTLHKTIDGGKTWEKLSIPRRSIYSSFRQISFITKDTGFVRENAGYILKTTDGGKNWQEIGVAGALYDLHFKFFNQNEGWLVHRNGAQYTKDGGKTWTFSLGGELSTDRNYVSGYFLDINNGWAYHVAGNEKILFRTRDKGVTWERIVVNNEIDLMKLYFWDNLHGYGGNNIGTIYYTEDGGYNWIPEKRIVENAIFGFTKDYNAKIWACGNNFIISKKDSNLTSIAEDAYRKIPATFELKQNYPNPFNPSTTIEYSIPEAGMVTLMVYNVLGQEIKTIVNEYKLAGKHSEFFTLRSSLSSGIYYCTLKSGRYTKSIKMILLK